ncbi:MAG TPA: TonB-dependent siderophore receptor [Gemmatimonadaceae bacterium]|nr:TonB-dependent siderophore receptor [Gemmatimonadaceae bacterium]
MLKTIRPAAVALFFAVSVSLDSSVAVAQIPTANEPSVADSTRADSARTSKVQSLDTVRVAARAKATRYSGGYSRTSTKIPALARDVPQSLTTVTATLVKDQAMKSMAEVVRYMPGVTMGQGEGNRDQPTIRGNSTTADFFVDGVRDDAQYFRDLYNLERVEALKGSNAMVFGRGGGGGILNRVTKEAEWDNRQVISAEAASFGGHRVTADVNRGLSSQFAGRLNSVYESSRSFRNGVSLERSGINPTATFASRSRATQLVAGYEHFSDRRTADRGVPSFQGLPLETSPSAFFGNPEQSRARVAVNAGTLTFSHDAGRVQVRSTMRLADYDKFYQNVFPGAVDAAGKNVSLTAYNHAIGRRNSFNQTDIIWSAGSGLITHQFLSGMEFGREKTTNYRATGFFGTATSFSVPVSRPVFNDIVTFRQSASDADNSSLVRTSSVYAQNQISISQYVRLLAGVRYEDFSVRYTDNRSTAKRSRADRVFSPRAGLIIKPNELTSVYASVSRSFLPGSGDQFTTLTAITQALKPERFTNLEAGAKWDVMDRLSLTAAAYRLDRTNTRATDPNNPANVIQTGAQRSKGFELGAAGSITSAWDIAAGYARQEAKIVRATAASPAGASVPLVPSTTLSLWNKYSLTSQFGAGLGIVRQAKVFSAVDNKVTLPAFTRFDASVYAPLGFGLRTQLNVENLFNVRYFPTSNGNNNISPGSPRAAKLSITATF